MLDASFIRPCGYADRIILFLLKPNTSPFYFLQTKTFARHIFCSASSSTSMVFVGVLGGRTSLKNLRYASLTSFLLKGVHRFSQQYDKFWLGRFGILARSVSLKFSCEVIFERSESTSSFDVGHLL